jgi:hypothetical protein
MIIFMYEYKWGGHIDDPYTVTTFWSTVCPHHFYESFTVFILVTLILTKNELSWKILSWSAEMQSSNSIQGVFFSLELTDTVLFWRIQIS